MAAKAILSRIRDVRSALAETADRDLAAIVDDVLDEAFFDAAVRGTKTTGAGSTARLRRAPRVESLLDRMYKRLWDASKKLARKQVDLATDSAVKILKAMAAGPKTKKAETRLRRAIFRDKTLDLDQKTELLSRHVKRNVDAQVATRVEETVDTMKAAGMNQQAILDRFKRLETVDALGTSLKKMLKSSYEVYGRRVASDAEVAAFKARGYKKYLWVAVNRPDGTPRLCPDCSARHGVVGSESFWDEMGRPGSGRTVCGAYCWCALVPKEYADASPDAFATPIEDSRPLVLTTNKDVVQLDKRGPGVLDRDEE